MVDLWDHPEAKEFVQQVLDDMRPKMEGSAVVAQLIPEDPEGDVKFWVELGASIMLEKPIVALVLEGRSIPGKLNRIADRVVHMTGDDAVDARRIQEVVEELADD